MLSLLHLSKRDFRRGSCGKFLAFLLHDLQRRPRTSPCTFRLSRCSSALSCALIAPIAAVTCDLTRLPSVISRGTGSARASVLAPIGHRAARQCSRSKQEQGLRQLLSSCARAIPAASSLLMPAVAASCLSAGLARLCGHAIAAAWKPRPASNATGWVLGTPFIRS